MRILLIVHGFPPAAQGGSEIYAHAQACALRDLYGDEILILTRENDAAAPELRVRMEQRQGLSIAWINNTFRHTRTFAETYRNDAITVIARRIIEEFRPDIAHIHHLTCLSTTIIDVLAQAGIPSFYTLHDYWLMCHRGQLLDSQYRVCDGPGEAGCHGCLGLTAGLPSLASKSARAIRSLEATLPTAASRLMRSATDFVAAHASESAAAERQAQLRVDHMRHLCSRITHFVAPSRHMRDRFVPFGVAPERITVADYGFDHRAFAGVQRTATRVLRLGFLGSLMISKGPHVLLKAFRDLPAGAFSVDLFGSYVPYHGDDGYKQELEPLLSQPGVRWHGLLAHDDIATALASIDVLIVPSIWPENSPLVVHEAFLAGVPVVASRTGGIPELVAHNRNGLLFEPGDEADLHRTLLRLVREGGLLDALRAGVPQVRTIEDDVGLTRGLYAAHLPSRAPAVRSPRLAAIVLNYRAADDTLLAVKSLLASRRPVQDIIVIDNDSTEDCRRALKNVWSEITYLRSDRNVGFSGGINVGVREALALGADLVILVNSDVIVAPDCIEHLEACLERAPAAGIAGPVVLSRSDPGRVASLGMSYVGLTGRMRHRGANRLLDRVRVGDDSPVKGVSGCLMLIRRRVFEAVGLFDEDYFFSFEDLDFCLRARRAGYPTMLAAAARAYHEGSRSIGADSPRRLYFAARNHLLMAQRADPAPNWIASFCRASSIVLLNLAHAAISTCGSPAARFAAVARGTRDYMAGRRGDEPVG